MIRDLRTIIDGWDYEPGKISVRKIIGRDGREKIQTRIDLGLLQLEVSGRPDGRKPRGAETLLEYFETQLADHRRSGGNDDDFVLSPEDCRELRHEAYLLYQRYLSQFVLEDFDAVVGDTAFNLRIINLCERYAAAESDREALKSQKSYVLMMNARAKVCRAMHGEHYETALAQVDRGLAEVRAAQQTREDELDPQHETEIQVLEQLRQTVIERMPADCPVKVRSALQKALDAEDYETAARLRDQLTSAQATQRRVC